MAYAFDRIMDALGQNNQEEEQQPSGGQSLALTSSSEGDLSGGGGSPTSPSVPSQQQVQAPSTGGNSKIMNRNKNRSQAPVDTQRISDSVQSARQNIQNEANSYISGAAQPYDQTNVKSDVRQYAESGNPDFLQKLQTKGGAVKDIDLKTNTDNADVDLLQNDAGIRELYRRRGDAEYNIGEAALDAALLRQNQPFQFQRGDILNSYKQLQTEKGDILQNSREKAQKVQDDAEAAWKGSAKTALSDIFDEYEAKQRGEEAEFDKLLAANESERAANLRSYAEQAAQELRQNNPELAQFINSGDIDALQREDPSLARYYTGNVNLNDFYQPGTLTADKTDWRDFVDQDESAQFERILSALGRGGETMVPGQYSGKSAAEVLGGGFNKDAFQNVIRSRAELAQKKKAATDADIKSAQTKHQESKAASQAAYEKQVQKAKEIEQLVANVTRNMTFNTDEDRKKKQAEVRAQALKNWKE